MTDDIDTFLSSLDAEVSQLTAKPRLEEDRKKLVQKLRKTDPDRTTRMKIASEIAQVNQQIDALQWRNLASVALFQEQHCTYCASTHRLFLQFMLKQSTTSGPKCTRYQRVDRQHFDLPREVVVHKSKTTMCADCAEDFDFELETAAVKIAEHSEPFAIASGYAQVEEELEG